MRGAEDNTSHRLNQTEALTLIQSNDLVAYEDLKVKNMVRNHKLAKSINDVAWRQFRQWLEYFARKYNRQAIAVKPHYYKPKLFKLWSQSQKRIECTHP